MKIKDVKNLKELRELRLTTVCCLEKGLNLNICEWSLLSIYTIKHEGGLAIETTINNKLRKLEQRLLCLNTPLTRCHCDLDIIEYVLPSRYIEEIADVPLDKYTFNDEVIEDKDLDNYLDLTIAKLEGYLYSRIESLKLQK